MDYDNPSRKDLEHFRRVLFRRLLFEPFADPTFVRPTEKLRFLVRESEEMIGTLRNIVSRYDAIDNILTKAVESFDSGNSYMAAVQSFAFSSRSLDTFMNDLIASASLPPEERQERRKRQQAERRLQQEAQALCLEFLPMQPELLSFKLQCHLSQFLAAQVWVFLERSGDAVTKGTEIFFPSSGVPSNLGELCSDGMDELVNEAGLPGVTPVMHILEALFEFIRGSQVSEERAEEAWTSFELNTLLLSYFAWWTEGDGRSTVRTVVAGCSDTLGHHTGTAKAFGTRAGNLARAISDFQEKVERQSAETDSTCR